MQDLARLVTYSYLDVQFVIKVISRLSHHQRKLILSEATNGSAIYYKGKSHAFKLGDIMASACLAHHKACQVLFSKIKLGLNLCESIDFEVDMDQIKVCQCHNRSGILALFFSKLPLRFSEKISVRFSQNSFENKFNFNEFFLVVRTYRAKRMVLKRFEYDTFRHIKNQSISLESITWMSGSIRGLKPSVGYFRLDEDLCLWIDTLGYYFLKNTQAEN